MVDYSDSAYRLQRELNELEYALSGLRTDLGALARRFDVLDLARTEQGEQIDSIQASLEEIVDEVANHESDLNDLRTTIARVTRRDDWLEQHLCRLTGLQPTDIGRQDSKTRARVQRIHDGNAARLALLHEEQRAEVEERCNKYDKLQGDKLQWDHRLVEATKAHRDQAGHPVDRSSAQTTFELATSRVHTLDQQLNNGRRQYQEDREQLARDDAERQKAQPGIESGHQARTELLAQMRNRINTAVDSHDLFPRWFTHSLGYSPPTDRTNWVDVAAEVLTYRLTYDIEDPETALGDRSSAATDAQKEWRAQLAAKLDRLA